MKLLSSTCIVDSHVRRQNHRNDVLAERLVVLGLEVLQNVALLLLDEQEERGHVVVFEWRLIW